MGGGGFRGVGGVSRAAPHPPCSRSEATLHRYEVHPHGTFPHGPGPEFRTTVKVTAVGRGEVMGGGEEDLTQCLPPPAPQVQNLGCFAVRDVTLRLALPSLGYGRVPFLSVTGVRAENVSERRRGEGEGKGRGKGSRSPTLSADPPKPPPHVPRPRVNCATPPTAA